MSQVSFQYRLIFLAAIQTFGFHTTKLLGYLSYRGFLTKAFYNKTFPPVNFGSCIAASKTRSSKLYRFHSAWNTGKLKTMPLDKWNSQRVHSAFL